MLLFGCNQGFGGPQGGKGECGCPTGQKMEYKAGSAGAAVASRCVQCPVGTYADTSKLIPPVVKACSSCKVCGHLQRLHGCTSGSTARTDTVGGHVSSTPSSRSVSLAVSSAGECYCTAGRYAMGKLCLRYDKCASGLLLGCFHGHSQHVNAPTRTLLTAHDTASRHALLSHI
jgi:hypothetical protein